MLRAAILSVANKPIMLSVIMLSVIILSVSMLSVVMLNVLAPQCYDDHEKMIHKILSK